MTLQPVVFSFGMGLDSSIILKEWCEQPTSRDFDLQHDLVVIAAQPGGESQKTQQQMEQHILPLMREHHIRFIQIARAGPSLRDGYTVLDDSRAPTILHIGGAYTLYDELAASGTVPQFASGKRQCSDKYKGAPIGMLLRDRYGMHTPIRHVLGYAADEERRIAKAATFHDCRGVPCVHEFPLQRWGFDRAACAAKSMLWFDTVIAKSCCAFCPFAQVNGGTSEMLARYRQFPAEGASTMLLEHVALALNPRMTLYPGGRSAIQTVQADGNDAALALYTAALQAVPWAMYHVERVYTTPGMTDRRVSTIATGSRAAMHDALVQRASACALPLDVADGDVTPRLYVRRRGAGYPALEETTVIAPALARDKSRARFASLWARHTQQLTLFGGGAV